MSTTTSITEYNIQLSVTQTATGNQDIGFITLTSNTGCTDEVAAAFVAALEASAWPSGTVGSVMVSKSTSSTTSYTTDTATSPITFT